MHILLIGGNGFIGTYLARRLCKNQKLRVSIVHIHPLIRREQLPRVKYYRINTSKKSSVLSALIKRASVIVILTRPNTAIIRTILEAVSAARQLKKIVYTSTLLVYPDLPRLHTESDSLEPESQYERAKVLEERLLVRGLRRTDVGLCIARLSNVYGDVKNRGLIHWIFSAALHNEKFVMNGNGTQVRDYIYVDDVARFMVFLILRKQESSVEIFNIATGRGYTIRQLIGHIQRITRRHVYFTEGPQQSEKHSSVGSNKKILQCSKYLLPHTLTWGLKRAYTNYLKADKNHKTPR